MRTDERYDEDESTEGLVGAINRFATLAGQGTGLLWRVSTAMQKRTSTGSLRYQTEQIKLLEQFGAPTDRVRIFDARGESAAGNKPRPVFRSLIEAVLRREIMVVLVSDVDRVARNDPDAEELYAALQKVGGLLVANGEIFDPRNASHRFILGLRSLIASYENKQRAFRSLSSKSAKARELGYPIKLARGLVWASPDDAEFVKRMERAGLEHLISADALAEHKARVRREGRTYYALPFPDRDVELAGRLTVRWLIEEGSLTGLLHRIETDSQWPKPGMFPAVGGHRISGAKAVPDWNPIGGTDGRIERARTRLYEWLLSPSIYGTYQASFPQLRQIAGAAASLGWKVTEDNAFPGFAPTEDRARVREILRSGGHPRFLGRWRGPRNHALPRVRCVQPMEAGRLCDRKLNAMYSAARAGEYRYTAVACGIRGHRYSLPASVDALVLRVVRDEFSADRLRSEMERVNRRQGADHTQLQRLEVEVRALEAKAAWENEEARRAHDAGDAALVDFHRRLKRQALDELAAKEDEVAKVRAQTESIARFADDEYEQILQLASDFPKLLDRAMCVEGKVREILREVLQRVNVQRVGEHTFAVEVVFWSGQSKSEILVAKRIRTTAAIRALAGARLSHLLAPKVRRSHRGDSEAHAKAHALADFINTALGQVRGPAWDANRVLAAAYMHAEDDSTLERDAMYVDVGTLAKRIGVADRAVLKAALSDLLGPVRADENRLLLAPTSAELHRTFPDYARREVAREAGWPEDDTVELSVLQERAGWDGYRSTRVAERGAGLRTDGAGRTYTRESMFVIPEDGDLERVLTRHIPRLADRTTGRWMTFTEARALLPGVNTTTYEKHTSVVRPGFGENGLSSCYVWIDRHVRAAVWRPTVEEAAAAAGLREESARFILRDEAIEILRARFGSAPSLSRWHAAVADGHVIQLRARTPESRRMRAYVWIPDEVRSATCWEVVERFLAGAYRPLVVESRSA